MIGIVSDPRAGYAPVAFPTLDADLGGGVGGCSGPGKRVCIATPDILGPIRNGGIGTAYHHLARLLAGWGHEVLIAYVNGNAADARLMGEARALYAGFGVAFEPIVPRPASKTALQWVSAPTWALYDWLRTRERAFDVVYVPEWRGLGYGPLLAKSLGLAFGATHFVVHGHSPTLWAVEGNRQLLHAERELGWVFMERRSVELADTLICGSAHLLGWMRDAGYALPARSFVWPNPFPAPDPSPAAEAERAARDGAALAEVVFFGRLEPRKGLVLFVDAIERLVRRGGAPARVTFLGKVSSRIDGPEFIRSAVRGWPVEVRTLTGFGAGEALGYLSRPGRLAVIPSLLENSSMAVMECLQAGIPFVAAATGGTPELVAPEDRGRALVAPDHVALGEHLAALARAPLRAVRPRWDFERSLEVWSRWHARSAPFEATAARFAERTRAAGTETPLVTVCLVHHERPALVRMAVDSVLAQDYPALEAVLVDDGSEGAEALAVLAALETEFAERGWRVVRQDNRYPGAARNAAAAAARGEWLLLLDDDNVLFPDAVSRLVRAARFCGADCVPAASIRFCGDGDPRTDTASHGTPTRFLGAARAWSRFRNVVGDTCALVRREAFEAVGGFTEEYRVGLYDLSFFNRLLHAGYRIEPMPDPAYYYRVHPTSITGTLDPSAPAVRALVLAPHLQGLPDEERAYAAYAAASQNRIEILWKEREGARHLAKERKDRIDALWKEREGARHLAKERKDRIDALWKEREGARHLAKERKDRIGALMGELETARMGHVMAFAQRGARFGIEELEVGVLLNPEWVEQAGQRRDRGPALDLRRNGRLVARAFTRDLSHNVVRFAAGLCLPAVGCALYSLHDARSGEVLAALAAVGRRGRRVIGAVESRPWPEVRGWALDPGDPGRSRRVALHVDGRLCKVVGAEERRADVARWQGTEGRHGFRWRIPEGVAVKDGTRIEVFDADTGRRLRGSPLRIEGGRAVASTRYRT